MIIAFMIYEINYGDGLAHPSFVRSPGPVGEGDSLGLQSGGSSLEQVGFSRGFSAALRSQIKESL